MAATAEQAATIAAAEAQIKLQQNAIAEYEAFIQQEQENIVTARAYIAFAESQIADETLPDAQRLQYEDNIVDNLEVIALNENAIEQNQNNITNAENQIAADQEVIAITSDTANSTLDPAPVPATGDEALAAIDQETADLLVAAESASPLPIDPITEALLAEQELTRQAMFGGILGEMQNGGTVTSQYANEFKPQSVDTINGALPAGEVGLDMIMGLMNR